MCLGIFHDELQSKSPPPFVNGAPAYCPGFGLGLWHQRRSVGAAALFSQHGLQRPVERRDDQDRCALPADGSRAPGHRSRLVRDGVRGEGRNAWRLGAAVGVRLCGLCDARCTRAPAVRKLLPLSRGTGMTRPKRLGDFTHELYIHMRVLSASNSQEDVDGTMSALEKHSPAVWDTLTPGAWGEPGVD